MSLVGLGYAGFVKGLPVLADVAVDLTGLFTLLVGAGVVSQIVRGRLSPRPIVLIMALWITFLVGAMGGLWYETGPYKVGLLFTVSLLCALAPAALLISEQSRRWLIGGMVVGGLIMAGALLLNPDSEYEALYGRLTLEGSNSIGTARVVGAGAAAALVMGLTMRRYRWLWLGAATAMAAVLVLVGSRGPFVGLVVAVILAVLISKYGHGLRRVWIIIVGSLAVLCLMLVVTTSENRAAGRIGRLITGANTDETRLSLLQQGIAAASNHPLGIGWGGYATEGIQGALRGAYFYPHNMSLEVFVEGGWLPGLVFLVVAVLSLLGFWRCSTNPQGSALLAIGLYWLIVAHTSGDVNANRMTWITIGLGLVLISEGRSGSNFIEPRQSSIHVEGAPATNSSSAPPPSVRQKDSPDVTI